MLNAEVLHDLGDRRAVTVADEGQDAAVHSGRIEVAEGVARRGLHEGTTRDASVGGHAMISPKLIPAAFTNPP